MDRAISIGLPLLVMLAMTIVGLELTLADLRRVLHYPLHVAAAVLGQLIALPLIAAGLIVLLHPAPAIAGGLLLTAAAPQATISNYYCLLARADIALAVTLTAVSSLLALVSTPLVAGIGFAVLLDTQAGFGLPAGKVMQQVVNGLLLPIAAGMFIRHCAPGFVQRHRLRLRALSLVALAALLTLVLIDQAATIQRHLAMIVTLTTLFTAAAAGIGFGLARGASWSYSDTITMVSAFPARSLSIATLIAVNVLGRVEFLSFAVVFFLVQGVLLAPLMLWARPRAATP